MTAAPHPDNVVEGQRERIVDAAIALLIRDGRDALTTRNVAAAAGVQAPTLYRLFGDKRGLLDAVAEQGFARYLHQKQGSTRSADPLDDLRDGWNLHVEFGLSHPAIYVLMVGDPRPDRALPADTAGRSYLHRKIRALAQAGQLQVSEEQAAQLFHAACSGVVLTLLSLSEDQRDPSLSVLARESVLATMTGGAAPRPDAGLSQAAITLKALLPESVALSAAERLLMTEWLTRLATPAPEERRQS
ncbi:TetR/AcrR family transcriptional regulator [Deinococcus yunweiensis]|uniref:TetR/AcrR family transcriptional regulator n=1 Tax=Deinococcus yunweiensis TaxID=367282 RepID=UPI00398F3C25